MWLSNKILTWAIQPLSSTIEDRHGMHRPYEIWKHAESLLNSATDNFHRIDAITTIKRSIDHRLRHLRNLYHFDDVPIKDKPKRIIEQLAYFGIIRPTMLEKIILLRNQIEHADAPPPDRLRCLEFLDFSWYFLRSTDRLVNNIVSDFMLVPSESTHENHHWLEITMGPNSSWKVSLRGWVPRRLFSKREHKDWLNLTIERLDIRKDFLERLPKEEKEREITSATRGKNLTDVYFNGVLDGSEKNYKELANRYFSTF